MDDVETGQANEGICEMGGLPEDARGTREDSDVGGHQGLVDNLLFMAAGDFLLLSKRTYFRIWGFHEVLQNAFVDPAFLCKCRAAGVRQVAMKRPCLVFHQPHPRIISNANSLLHSPGFRYRDNTCSRIMDGRYAAKGCSVNTTHIIITTTIRIRITIKPR